MNIQYFRESLEYISYCGYQLNPEKAAFIENSLIILQSENKFEQIFFWGCINGNTNDYYISFGYTKDCLCGRRFFYSTNCINWFLLPQPNLELSELCILITSQFEGDTSFSVHLELDPKFITDIDGTIKAGSKHTKQLKEETRLACIVHLITEESALVPRGALHKSVNGRTVYNPMFNGISQINAMKANNFLLYRKPKQDWNSNLLKRQDYNFSIDIFDTIDLLVPRGKTFSLTMENDRAIVFLKSLYWPGMVFFHKCRSKKHGFCYFGTGKKNLDLLFTI